MKVSAYITERLNEELIRYCSLTGKSKSSAIESFIENGLNLESTKNDINFITNEIDRSIEARIKPLENRISKITAKNAKSSLSALYLLIQIFNDSEKYDELSIKDLVENANKKAYQVLKDGYLEKDIMTLFKG